MQFPLIYDYKTSGAFIKGERYTKDELKELRKIMSQYEAVCKKYNEGLINKDTELDLSFCNYPPLPKQELPIKLALHFPRAFIYGKVGSGKTYVSGYIAVYRLLNNIVRNVLIITPKAAIKQWEEELKKFFNFPHSWINTKIKIVNFEALYGRDKLRNVYYIKDEYKDIDFVIVDESHKIKNPFSLTSNIVCTILKNSPYRILMTGTPIRNMATDLYIQLSVINPWAFRMTYRSFVNTFFTVIEMKKFKKYIFKPYKTAALMELIDKNTIKMEKEDKEDKGIVFHTEKININNTQQKYSEIVAEEVIKHEGKLIELKNILMKMQQVSSGFIILSSDRKNKEIKTFDSPKINATVDKASSLVYRGEKVIIFAKFHETIDRLLDKLTSKGIKTAEISGRITQKKADIIRKEFTDGNIQALIIQINKGELALNLQVASNVIFVEYDWIPALIEQCIGRVYRTGQKDVVNVYMYITKNSIDEVMLNKILNKEKVNTKILKQETMSILNKIRRGG